MTLSAFLYSLVAGMIPALIWLFFWLQENRLHPEPRSIIAGTFIGGSLSVFVAVLAEKYVATVVADANTQYIIWAGIEEFVKFCMVAVVAFSTRYYEEPVDAMIYCVTVALGFAALENTFFIMDPLSHGQVAQGILAGNLRFMGPTLVHTVSSAFVGFTLGLSFYRGALLKAVSLIFGLTCAIALHAVFNLSIISSGSSDATLKTFAWVWGAIVILIILFEEVKAVHPRAGAAKAVGAAAELKSGMNAKRTPAVGFVGGKK